MKSAYNYLIIWAVNCGAGGFVSVENDNRSISDIAIREHELRISDKMDELYTRAKKIIYENQDYILSLTDRLLEEETLLSSDIMAS